MNYEDRVPEELVKDGHYLGRPADMDDKIIRRRVDLVKNFKGFCGKGLELLEIGCGNGASMFLLAPEFKNCFGIEIENSHLEEFKNFKAQLGIENVDCTILDIEREDLPKQYDRIISFEVIEHLKDDRNVTRFLSQLKDDGLMAISVPNKWWIFETHGAKLPLLPWNRVPFFSWLPRFIHERFANARIYTKSRIRKLLESTGFEILEISYITAPMDVLKDGKLKRWLVKNIFNKETTMNPFLSTSIFVVARKKL